MPVIVIGTPKGGSGKSTLALVTSLDMADLNYPTTLIDADPNRPILRWAAGGNVPAHLKIVEADERTIIKQIAQAAAETPIVIIDLEGTAAKIVLLAFSQADLVLIPVQGSQLDAEQANRAVEVVTEAEQVRGRPLPYRLVFTRTNPAVRPRTIQHIYDNIEQAGYKRLNTPLHERDAYRGIFSFRKPLESLDPKEVPGLVKAKANARAIVYEILEVLSGKPVQPPAEDMAVSIKEVES